jgi:HK97 family phage prohead protease
VADPKTPYGPKSEVTYADPGYQEDGKARYPLDTADHVRAAWSYINMPKNAAKYTAEQVAKIKARIKAAGKKFGVEFSDEAKRTEPEHYARSWALDGIEVLRASDGYGDGRTVKAYATPFDVPTEITDQHGHYYEVIDRTAFNRTLSHGIDRVGVYYHHGLTIHGTPSDLGSIPIGSPLEIRPDGKGLLTVTRFNASPMAEGVLEAIRNGDLRGYSFRGQIYKSNPSSIRRVRNGSLPTVRRMELGLKEYGPTPTPAYREASIEAIRAALQEILATTPPRDPDAHSATPDVGPGAEDPRETHSTRQQVLRFKRALRERGLSNG